MNGKSIECDLLSPLTLESLSCSNPFCLLRVRTNQTLHLSFLGSNEKPSKQTLNAIWLLHFFVFSLVNLGEFDHGILMESQLTNNNRLEAVLTDYFFNWKGFNNLFQKGIRIVKVSIPLSFINIYNHWQIVIVI